MKESIIKTTSSIYRVLEYFPASDPIKNKAKEKVLFIMDLATSMVSDSSKIIAEIDSLLGYLKVANGQGWLSNANYILIENEYTKIISDISKVDKKETVETTSLVLNKKEAKDSNFFDIPKEIPDRQKKIVEFLRHKNGAQVMDLQVFLKNVTKRTIRRDLDELLKKGMVLRHGEFNKVFYKLNSSAVGQQ